MLLPLVRSLRPKQWVKNAFVLAPLVFAERLGDPHDLARSLLGFALFCAASSAVYLVNDLRDREEDRNHPIKRLRPLAAGTLAPGVAVVAAVLLTATVVAGSVGLGVGFLTLAVGYLLLQFSYSMWLKQMVIIDVMAISLGFVLRVMAGAQAIEVQVSSWLLLCTIFVSLFLAFSKRRHELLLLPESASLQRGVLSHYSPAFLDQMVNVVTASTVLSYTLYAIAPETVEHFGTGNLVFTVPLVLFGIFRYLYLMYQRPTERNPTEAILNDPPFLVNMALWALAVAWIIYG